MNYADEAQVIEALRAVGHNEQDIEQVIADLSKNYIELSWVADYIEAVEAGDDDEAFMAACALGIS